MLSKQQIEQCLKDLNEELRKRDQVGEIGIVGGAAMCLVYNARAATKDVDAVFAPTHAIRQAAAIVAAKHGLPEDWLNDAAKGYITGDFRRENIFQLSNLSVWAPETRYMLAMKCISARWDTSDKDDVLFLIKTLGLVSAPSVFAIIEKYYPHSRIPPRTRFFLEEVFDASGLPDQP